MEENSRDFHIGLFALDQSSNKFFLQIVIILILETILIYEILNTAIAYFVLSWKVIRGLVGFLS